MNLTKYISKKTSLIPYDEGGYKAFNSGGVECEVGEFLYSLVRIVKPEKILETGTHKGISSSYFGLGLKHNKKGHLDTIEFDPQHYQDSLSMWAKLGISEYITQLQIRSETYVPSYPYDIVFLDTEPDVRFKELVQFYKDVVSGGFIIIHDLNAHLGLSGITAHGMDNWPFGDFRLHFGDMLLDHELQTFNFKSPRGLTVFQKFSPEFISTKYLRGEMKRGKIL